MKEFLFYSSAILFGYVTGELLLKKNPITLESFSNPRYKVNDCFFLNYEEKKETWEHDRGYFGKIKKVGKEKYLYQIIYTIDKQIEKWSTINEIIDGERIQWVDERSTLINCPKEFK